MKPFIKWAGGKRWLTSDPKFKLPRFTGKYIEPFLGGGAVFFHLCPNNAILSDVNPKLIEVYQAIKDDWEKVINLLINMQKKHSKNFYYEERARCRKSRYGRAAQFLYLNRTCWNGLYRENLRGEFNVPIGTKSKIIFEEEDFSKISLVLQGAEIISCDFEDTISRAQAGDLLFVDPPYTTAHNMNGFIKYNQNIFKWDDQVRLKNSVERAINVGAHVIVTNADHESIHELYRELGEVKSIPRPSVISGKASGRRQTTEAIYFFSNIA